MDALPSYLGGLLAVLLLTSFAKIFTSLSILRYGLGLHGAGFGVVLAGLALALSFLVIGARQPQQQGIQALLGGSGYIEQSQLEAQTRPFLERYSDPEVIERLKAMASRLAGAKEGDHANKSEEGPVPFPLLVSSFLLTELKEAFRLGLLFIIPFVVIDLLVANAFLALGVTQLPQQVAALPLKLLLFIAVDGWTLVTEKLLGTYLS